MIAPANTGSDKRRRTAVIPTDQTNKGIRSNDIEEGRIFKIVVIKFTAPRIDEIPAKWREKIERSTEGPAWAIPAERGG